MTELARLMTELRRVGLTDTQIVDLVLHIESEEDMQEQAAEKNKEERGFVKRKG